MCVVLFLRLYLNGCVCLCAGKIVCVCVCVCVCYCMCYNIMRVLYMCEYLVFIFCLQDWEKRYIHVNYSAVLKDDYNVDQVIIHLYGYTLEYIQRITHIGTNT